MRRHLVRHGECAISLAARLGYAVSTLWDHPLNRELRERRRHPAFLAEGDVIVIPEPRATRLNLSGEQGNRYRATVPLTNIKLRLVAPETSDAHASAGETRTEGSTNVHELADTPLAVQEQPIGGVRYRLEVGGRVIEGTTDGSGQIDVDIPAAARFGKLTIGPGTQHEIVSVVHVGAVGPHNDPAGLLHRLQNMGIAVLHDADNPRRALAVSLSMFQAKYGLRITGELDADTRSALEQRHGI